MKEKMGTATRPIVISILIGAVIIGAGIGVGLYFGLRDDDDAQPVPPTQPGQPVYKSASGRYHYASVSADTEVCSNIGTDILARLRGNAVDAAVATLFCTGVMSSHSTGLGGGSFFTIYHKADNKFYSVDSRESAPAAAHRDMYKGEENKHKSVYGPLAPGVPGYVKGLYEVHQRFGAIAWKPLVLPTFRLCDQGLILTDSVHGALNAVHNKTEFEPYFEANGDRKPAGSLIKLPALAQTFMKIADDPMSFYNGSLASDIVNDLRDEGGIITEADLANYTVKWTEPTNITLPGGYQVYSTPPPGSGLVLSYILGILSRYNMDPSSVATTADEILTYHRMVEAFKFAYSKRSELGDEDFHDNSANEVNMTSPEFWELTRQKISDTHTHDIAYYKPSFQENRDSGTTHLSVIDGEGNAVGCTSTINTYFGSQVRGRRTGIVFNNEMDDFSTPNTTNFFNLPASPSNFIVPGKRPMSSMCPVIVWDSEAGQVKMVIGAAGGSKITTHVSASIMDVLYFGRSLPESVDRRRIHHQLFPNRVMLEQPYSQAITDGLKSKGHEVEDMYGWSVIQAIDVEEDGHIVGVADFRKGGKPGGY